MSAPPTPSRTPLPLPAELFRCVFEESPIGMAILDTDGYFLQVNRALCESLGYEAQELLGETFLTITHPEDARRSEELTRALIAGERSTLQMEKRYRGKRGRIIWGRTSVRLVRDDQGAPHFVVAQVEDITLRKEAELALRQSQERLRALVTGAPVVLYCLDTEGVFLLSEGAGLQLLGLRPGEVVGRSALELYGHLPGFCSDFQRVIGLGEATHREFQMPGNIVFDVRQSPLRDSRGRVTGLIGVGVDVTSRKRTENQLREAIDAAKAAAHAKSDFVATISHEIRTPMNAILGLARLLSDTQLTGEQQEYVSLLAASTDGLLGILNQVLDYSKMEAGHLQIEQEPYDVFLLCQQAVELWRAPARSKDIVLALKYGEYVPREAVGDGDRVRQVLTNLLSNAVKFTERGRVTLEVRGGEIDGREALEFRVVDTGVGIAKKDLRRIFERYAQAGGSGSKRRLGTGLGLPICRRLADRMGGRLEATSRLQEGSTFLFVLPLQPPGEGHSSAAAAGGSASDAVGAAAAKSPGSGGGAGSDGDASTTSGAGASPATSEREAPCPRKVLLVEDNAINQKVAVRMLEKLGYCVEVAGDGRTALSKVQASLYDLILMDYQMPDMNGAETTKAIRSLEGAAASIPIVAITANAFEADRQRCLDSGMDDFLGKPVRWEELEAMLHRWAPLTGESS